MKQINFLGFPVNVIDDEEIERQLQSDDPKIVMVTRVVDVDPALGSAELRARRTRTLCEGCREICWLDPKGYAEIALLHPTILCVQCVAARVGKA